MGMVKEVDDYKHQNSFPSGACLLNLWWSMVTHCSRKMQLFKISFNFVIPQLKVWCSRNSVEPADLFWLLAVFANWFNLKYSFNHKFNMHLYIFKKRLFILYTFDMTLEVKEFFFQRWKREWSSSFSNPYLSKFGVSSKTWLIVVYHFQLL